MEMKDNNSFEKKGLDSVENNTESMESFISEVNQFLQKQRPGEGTIEMYNIDFERRLIYDSKGNVIGLGFYEKTEKPKFIFSIVLLSDCYIANFGDHEFIIRKKNNKYYDISTYYHPDPSEMRLNIINDSDNNTDDETNHEANESYDQVLSDGEIRNILYDFDNKHRNLGELSESYVISVLKTSLSKLQEISSVYNKSRYGDDIAKTLK